ncbi:hypothetical protein SAMN04487881_0986 [Marinobacter sp. es.048]|uniref:hypothetical protein n=1 Tax=Marinobacter sp. es.048 TaxID=1761795 RepID=UPI000B58AFD9|nr:hypothetical protein [Marinobacter sp. es.048]SNC64033.1 hypothetical protein SAMN04487881_0986 [Marinobacter sp. es.048]
MARKQIPIKREQQCVVTLRTMLLVLTGSLLVTLSVAVFITSYGYFRNYVLDQLAGHARDGLPSG